MSPINCITLEMFRNGKCEVHQFWFDDFAFFLFISVPGLSVINYGTLYNSVIKL